MTIGWGMAGLLIAALTLAVPVAAQVSRSPIAWVRASDAALMFQLRRTGAAVTIVGLGVWERGTPRGEAPLWQGTAAGQRVRVPRVGPDRRDRLFQKFQALGKDKTPLGAPQWVTDLSGLTRATQPIPWPKSIKGVQCVVDLADAVALGAKHVGLNVSIRDFLLPAPGADVETVMVDGEAIGISRAALAGLDAQIKAFTDVGINVTPIVLNYFPRSGAPDDDPLIHPRCDRQGAANPLSAFNLTNEKSARLFRALLLCFARRYADPAAPHGRVSGFIIGNEVQSHWHWNNLGKASPETVIREYADVLRTAWLAARSAHPALRVYVSMDYYWTDRHEAPDRTMPGRQLLDGLAATGKAEGDFDWNVAHHPYPEGLFDPAFWDDEDAGMGFDTPIVTFKNLEVLTAYLATPALTYRPPSGGAGAVRRVILSEQGFNCKADTPEEEARQAAAYALAYRKVSQMPGIDAFILHRHVDHRGEGGLKLGLRAEDPAAPTASVPGRKRRIWDVFQRADTPGWEDAFAFALPIAGLKTWDDARPFAGKIPEASGVGTVSRYAGAAVWDGVKQLWTATAQGALDWREAKGRASDGVRARGLFLHPKEKGAATATFPVTLPRLAPGKRLVLRFESVNGAQQPAPNGIRFAVQVDDTELWSTVHADAGAPRPAAIDLSAFAGRNVRLTFATDAQGNASFAWATWLAPAILVE